MLGFKGKYKLNEDGYVMADMPKNSSLFTTGNGYMGVRGSLEEFGEPGIQGCFVRGVFDEITEIVQPFADNIYMKKYYFDEEKLKRFHKQDSCINLIDFLLVRFTVCGKTFYPWDGEIISWQRYLDTGSAKLVRKVRFKDENGNITDFTFERFASAADDHLYALRASAKGVNHDGVIKAVSGVDTAVRTNGQPKSTVTEKRVGVNGFAVCVSAGEKYGHSAAAGIKNIFYDRAGNRLDKSFCDDGELIYECASGTGSLTVEKIISIYSSRESDDPLFDAFGALAAFGDYVWAECKHLQSWNTLFSYFDVEISGDGAADAGLRFANYHTVISAARNDGAHSLSAKALTGEKYNQFVWWDCEIYQLPIFIYACPQTARHALTYRYDLLDAARKNAAEEGSRGARYPFVSSVDGAEHVWIYARHPFLQIHITADVAYGVLNYYSATGDDGFMRDMGLEMLIEIVRYWCGRVTERGGKYVLDNVTGTDEHHPYVNNDAYTNYIVHYVLSRFIRLMSGFSDELKNKAVTATGYTDAEFETAKEVADKLYLPLDKNGLIPQFDGYFDLSETLRVDGSGTGTNFQMKQAGLYHLSQVIKQPDVMLLFSYINSGLPKELLAVNWDKYENLCEASSSLTFPVHAVCSALCDRPFSFKKYFNELLTMDIADIHNCAYQGVHAGCAAGGWFAVFRGVAGITVDNGIVFAEPHCVPGWKKVSFTFNVRSSKIKVVQTEFDVTYKLVSGEPVNLVFCGKEYLLRSSLKFFYGIDTEKKKNG